MPKITFQFEDNREDITVEVGLGCSILNAALDNNIEIRHKCGGNCSCTTCHCIIIKGKLIPARSDELDMLEDLEEDRTDTSRLSCQAQIVEDVIVKIPNVQES